jgi:hypothetical protein
VSPFYFVVPRKMLGTLYILETPQTMTGATICVIL